jgi:hypothetical protein
LRTEVCYAITSLDSHRAGPARLGRLARGQWQIENRLHWVRDVAFDEDHSQIRQGHGPQVMATFRNLTVSLLRRAGHHNIARGLRWAARDTTGTRALGLLGIESTPRARRATSWTPRWVHVSRGRQPTRRTSRSPAARSERPTPEAPRARRPASRRRLETSRPWRNHLGSVAMLSQLLHADDDRVGARRSPKPGRSVACTEDAIGEATTRPLAGVVSTPPR